MKENKNGMAKMLERELFDVARLTVRESCLLAV
jgi:hypothetical protein